MDHDKSQHGFYEFLDLSDVDDSERNHLTTALYSNSDQDQPTSESWTHDDDIITPETNTTAAKGAWQETSFASSESVCDIDYMSDSQSRATMSPHSNSQQQQMTNGNQNQNNLVQRQNQGTNNNNNNSNNNNNNNNNMHARPFIGQPGAVYQMIPPTIPGNVYVSNVTANVNVHGYMTQPVSQYPMGNQSYIAPETNQVNVVHDHQQPITNMHNIPNVRGNARRGRGRGNNQNSHRRDYNLRQTNTSQQELGQPLMETQSVMGAPGYPQYFINPYSYFASHPTPMGHPAAQHATGSPLYVTAASGHMPLYAGHQVYAYPQGVIYPSMVPNEYGVMVDEKMEENVSDGSRSAQNINCGQIIMHPIWPQHIPLEYQESPHMEMNQEEYVPTDVEDMNMPNYLNDQNQNPAQAPIVEIQSPPQIQPQTYILNPNVATFTSSKSQQSNNEGYTSINNNIANEPELQHQNTSNINLDSVNLNDQTLGKSNKMEPNTNVKVPPVNNNVKNENLETKNNLCEEFIDKDIEINNDKNNNNNNNINNISFLNNNNNNNINNNSDNSTISENLNDEKHINKKTILDINQNDNNNNIGSSVNVNHVKDVENVTQNLSNCSISATTVAKGPLYNSSLLNSQTITNSNKPQQAWSNNVNRKSTATVAVSAVPSMNAKDIQSIQTPSNPSKAIANSMSPQVLVTVVNNTNTKKEVSPLPFTNNSAVVKITNPPFVPNKISSSNINQNASSENVSKVIMYTPTVDKKTETPKNVITAQAIAPTSVSVTVVPQQLNVNDENIKTVESKQVEALPQNCKDVNSIQTEGKELNSQKEVSPAPPSSTKSWASLFSSAKSTTPTQIITSPNTCAIEQQTKKPVAKVFPFESTTNYNTPATQQPSRGVTYSSATIQNSSPSTINNNIETKLKSTETKTTKPAVVADWSFKLGNFFSKYDIDNKNISLVPRGLTNKSNYCYINAIIQALISCPPFYNLLRSIPSQPLGLRTNSITPIIDAMKDLSEEFCKMDVAPVIRNPRRERGQKREELLPDINTDIPFEPTVIHKMLNGIRSDVFQIEGRQEDAEEFLGCVLNKMNDEMLEVMKLVKTSGKISNNHDMDDPNDEGNDWQVIYGNRNKGSITRTTDFGRTPISDIFRGQLRSRVQREGDASSDVIQPFFTLQLDIEKAASVKEALEVLVGKDALEGVTCSKTNQEINAWQQVFIEELPIILILHLKCFDYKMESCTKILKTIEFPIELKIDGKLLSSKNKYTQKQRQYKLFAVVYHDGKEAVKGHYLTDVFHVGYNSWIRYDDSIVKSVSENNVLHPRAPRIPYLLYYRRSDMIGGSHQAQVK